MSGKTLRARLALVLVACVLAAGSPAFAQRVAPDVTKTKQSEALRAVFKDVSAQANHSTVLIRAEEKGTTRQVAFGTIIAADGFILTKASEVMGQNRLAVQLAASGTSTYKMYDAKVVGFSEAQDLAMLKIDATGLAPVTFADTRPAVADAGDQLPSGGGGGAGGGGGGRGGFGPNGGGGGGGGRGGRGGRGRAAAPPVMPAAITPPAPPAGAISVNVGEWVASANCGASIGKSEIADEPFAVGVISVSRRRIPGRNGFLGVSLGDAETAAGDAGGGAAGTGAKILQVIPDSAAEHAGVKVDDVITAVNGTPVANRTDLINTVQKYHPGDVVTLTIVRGDSTITLKAALGVNNNDTPEQSAMSLLLGGAVSLRASDFPAVYQHDTVMRPVDCGGPLVDLEGHVIGINIARAGRTETYALPADVITPLIEPMKSGKLAPVNANTPGPVKPGEKPATLPGKGE